MPKTAPASRATPSRATSRTGLPDGLAETKPGATIGSNGSNGSNRTNGTKKGHKRGFLFEFIRRPGEIGSFTPSSRFLAQKMVRLARVSEADVVVEYGVGTGPITGHIVKALKPGARFFGVEINPKFAEMARAAHPGVTIHAGSAEDIAELCAREGISPPGGGKPAGIDAIVSGIPWASLPAAVQTGILDATIKMLNPGGRLITFGYSFGLLTPAGMRFHKLLPKYFSKVQRSSLEWRNVPPAFAMECVK